MLFSCRLEWCLIAKKHKNQYIIQMYKSGAKYLVYGVVGSLEDSMVSAHLGEISTSGSSYSGLAVKETADTNTACLLYMGSQLAGLHSLLPL